ncbi:DUF2520 domain-containing protein [bacterium]|nr:DUF2520 domain-containing protein [bacterium]
MTLTSTKGCGIMRIGFIGAGRVGTAFGIYLKNRGFQLSGYLSRSLHSAKTAAELTDSQVYSNDVSLVKDSDLLFITCNDDQIESVARNIFSTGNSLKNRSFAHMSGALSSASLVCLQEMGAYIYSVHPMQSFADVTKSVEDLSNTTFGIEGPQQLEKIVSLLKKTGNNHLVLSPDQKTEYHIASCVVSNYLTALLSFGFNMMQSIGITQSTAISALAPMINGTIRNIIRTGPEKALTGPIARGDVETIIKHLQVFNAARTDESDTYKLLGRLTLALAQKEILKEKNKIEMLTKLLT